MPSKKTNSKTKPVQAAAAPPAPEPAPVVEAATPETAEQTWADKGADFAAKLQQVSALLTSLRAEFRSLDKTWSREFKAAQKAGAKRRRKSGNRSPSGFVKPTLISQELASFLDKPSGTEMARTEVTREINKYIRAHNLQDKNNGRKINPDAKLAKLLKLKKEDELTYFNLQRYMSPHFAKAGTKITTSA
jgi:upstream activation factor subunit UAF30